MLLIARRDNFTAIAMPIRLIYEVNDAPRAATYFNLKQSNLYGIFHARKFFTGNPRAEEKPKRQQTTRRSEVAE